MTDPVAFLVAELDRVEQLARATTEFQPYDEWTPVGVDKDDDTARSCWEVALIARPAVRSPSARSLMEHIAEHDPAAVLRRVAADRQILAGHQLELRDRPNFVLNEGAVPCCSTCWGAVWPCRTVLLLAEARGWTKDTT